ncbi:acylneuraminate cytidylyltransferase family protein [Rhodospirillaceae bacterium KN72]|uniref:Acylneuraminate cytidylyltransferase family protein n=1 Tax=Pacificispira spongiicola TaxID=2729598 RepID=A0A7Y0HF66_9PROT|nr:acylneuraminate cytidylyltransferase family protein [Pacificispira spongiicola]NMM45591.1 acylneuraminate cytidylyltransferase family protein [Pacificispira spongiicola]
MKRLCTICARGGSKGVPGKNVRMLLGKPLIAHTVEQARESGLFDHIAVSSDSDAILNAARDAGADILVRRPDEMALDTSAKLPAIQHCAKSAEAETGIAYDIFCDLDATSPLRDIADIRGAVEMMEAGGCDNVITGAPAHRSPYFNLVERGSDGFVGVCKKLDRELVRRQDAPACFDCNASIYVWTRHSLFEEPSVLGDRTALFEMPESRSRDIDSELDFEIVEFLMRRKERS